LRPTIFLIADQIFLPDQDNDEKARLELTSFEAKKKISSYQSNARSIIGHFSFSHSCFAVVVPTLLNEQLSSTKKGKI